MCNFKNSSIPLKVVQYCVGPKSLFGYQVENLLNKLKFFGQSNNCINLIIHINPSFNFVSYFQIRDSLLKQFQRNTQEYEKKKIKIKYEGHIMQFDVFVCICFFVFFLSSNLVKKKKDCFLLHCTTIIFLSFLKIYCMEILKLNHSKAKLNFPLVL